MAQHHELLELTAEIVTAHVGANAVTVDLLPRLIKQVFDALADAPRATPAVLADWVARKKQGALNGEAVTA